jgi:chromosome segregation protein
VTIQNRIIRSEEQYQRHTLRLKELEQKRDGLGVSAAPNGQIQDNFLSKITEIEQKRQILSDEIVTRETEAGETARALKEAENSLSTSRENRARIQALYGASQETQSKTIRLIQEKFDMTPEDLINALPRIDDFSEDMLEQKRHQRQQLFQQREALGPVNLQAETEADELEKQLSNLLNEKNDLIAAVEELRAGIKELNTEARLRLNNTFTRVNAHFQNLFKRLFVGGAAHLALIESDDPLEAGLEIFAQPPGKTLQALSLMSGGEQTMTSIALIFAMFLTNPAPICVLDEIDAPLDDANVDKVCDLLEEIAETTKTRFLIVTHHRLTMARMDRIYGVTMAEKGVSQLISLDMQQRFSFLEEAA